MTYPVSNQKSYESETDYNSYEEEGVGGDYDAEMQDGEWSTDDMGDMGAFEDEFIDETGEGSESSCPTNSLSDQEAYLECALEMLENTEFKDEKQKEAFKKQLEDQLRQLGMAHFLDGDALAQTLANVAETVSQIEGEIRATVKDAVEGGGSLQSQLEEFKAKVQGSTLSEAKKTEYITWIDQRLGTLELSPSDDMLEQISGELEDKMSQYEQDLLYPEGISSLKDATGLEMDQIQEILARHNIDINNLPPINDPKIAELLNDPEFASALTSAASNIPALKSDIKSFIDNNTATANATNEASQASDTSAKDSVDFTSYKNIWEANQHKDPKSLAFIEGRTAVATEAAKLLSALYGKTVTADTDPNKAGFITVDNQSYNMMTNSDSTKITIGSGEVDWVDAPLVDCYIDREGDGQTVCPDWMMNAGYPVYKYDNDDTELSNTELYKGYDDEW